MFLQCASISAPRHSFMPSALPLDWLLAGAVAAGMAAGGHLTERSLAIQSTFPEKFAHFTDPQVSRYKAGPKHS